MYKIQRIYFSELIDAQTIINAFCAQQHMQVHTFGAVTTAASFDDPGPLYIDVWFEPVGD